MKLTERIEAFALLGELLRDSLAGKQSEYTIRLNRLIDTQFLKNPWFTPDNVKMAINAIAEELTTENLFKWCSAYPALNIETEPANVGVIMAGNIPLAGFHDFLSVLISGNRIIARKSSKDPDLIELIAKILISFNPGFSKLITFTDHLLSDFEMVIASGSDNSSRYFEYYFGNYPYIIRKNRNSIAVIDGTESEKELFDLGTDIFSYFGLGCRNVSKIFLPAGYEVSEITKMWDRFSGLINHNKYANNYDFYKAVYLINNVKFIDTGYLILKEEDAISSPVSVLYYGFYNSTDDLTDQIENLKEKIQCITGHKYIPFGKAQTPSLWDYADGIDTIEFLLKKKWPGIL